MPDEGVGARIPGAHSTESRACVVDLLQKEAGNGTSAVDNLAHGSGSAREIKCPRFVPIGVEILPDVAVLPAELERVLSLDPRHQVIEDVGGASRDVSIVDPGRLTKLSKAVTES